MSLDGSAPGELLDRVGIFGHPYHGLVRGGKLTLPNAVEIDYPQPQGLFHDQLGATHSVVVPGTPEVERAPDEVLRDTANGYQWRNVAMLSGGDFQLYGTEIEGWIYTDPAGDRWRVTADVGEGVLRSFAASFTFNVTLSRFGVFGAEGSSHTHSVSINNWQQGGADLFLLDGTLITSGSLHVHAVKADGSAAALMICRAQNTVVIGGQTNINAPVRWPMGWAELSITGPGSSAAVSLQIIRSRAQTVVTQDAPEPTFDRHTGVYYRNPSTGDVYADLGPGESAPAPLPGYSAAGPGAFPVLSGSSSRTSYSKVIESLWPGDAGWVEVVRVFELIEQEQLPLPDVPTGSDNFERTATLTGTFAVRLEVDGVVACAVVADLEGASEHTVSYTTVPVVGGFATTEHSATMTLAGEVEETGFFAGSTTSMGRAFRSWALALRTGRTDLFAPPGAYLAGAGIFGLAFAERSAWFDLLRYSNNLLGLRMLSWPVVSEQVLLAPIAPDGAHGPDITQALNRFVRLYGSWCPHTGVAVWAQTEPVCFV